MAINFEAANMAGYNNPKIEVFKATSNENNEILTAPTKSNILGCLKRGCTPFILLTFAYEGLLEHYLFTFAASRETEGRTLITFTVICSYQGASDRTTLSLVYGPSDDSLPSMVQ